MPIDPLTIILFAVAALLIVFMFRNNKKRQRDLAEMQEKMVPGAEVMTNFGVYGTLLSLDDEDNQALVETTPGTILRVHRQTIARVIDSSHDIAAVASDADAAPEAPEGPSDGEGAGDSGRKSTD